MELCPVVGLDDMDPERQPLPDLIEELDRSALVAAIINLQYPDARALPAGLDVDGEDPLEALCPSQSPLPVGGRCPAALAGSESRSRPRRQRCMEANTEDRYVSHATRSPSIARNGE